MAFQSSVDPWDAHAASDAALPKALLAIFGSDSGEKLGRHETLRSQCCAQFVVSRERVRSHARDEYVALRQWLLDGMSPSSGVGGKSDSNSRVIRRREGVAPKDDRVAGRIVSYIWHILFLDVGGSGGAVDGGLELEKLNRAACPTAKDCYCRLYGRCNLDRCRSPGSCAGQYRIPPDYKVPGH